MQASLLEAMDGDAVVALTAAWVTRTLEMASGRKNVVLNEERLTRLLAQATAAEDETASPRHGGRLFQE